MTTLQLFSEFTQKLKKITNLTSRMEYYEDSFALKKYRISQISATQGLALLQNIMKKFYKYYAPQESGIWFQNELRLYVWALVCYMQISKKHIREFTLQEWGFFSKVFYVKQPSLFEYQARIILDYSLCLRKWSQQEDSLLTKIVLESKRIKWNQIAKTLFILSEKRFTRTSKQCRQRWLNHLDPCKTKLHWSLAECQVLFEAVLQKGKKWASLVQILNGKRSEHSIKNKFNSILIKQAKLTPQQNEKQNIRTIIQKIQYILSANKATEDDQVLFGESIRIMKQNQNQQEQHNLNKSSTSLENTLSLHSHNEPEQTLDYDEITVQPPSLLCLSLQSENISLNLRKRRSSKSVRSKNKENGEWEINLFDQNAQSFMGLQEIKLVIRESELDR